MSWPSDHEKLARVQALMAEDDLDALVVRAPDNILYLTNYWCMKGYDAAVVPREGEPTLCVIEPQAEEAAGVAWTSDIRPFASYDAADPRPPTARSAELALAVLDERGLHGRVGLELSQGTQGADRMVGEPTVFTSGYFETFPNAVDASGLHARAHDQDRAGDRADAARQRACCARA